MCRVSDFGRNLLSCPETRIELIGDFAFLGFYRNKMVTDGGIVHPADPLHPLIGVLASDC